MAKYLGVMEKAVMNAAKEALGAAQMQLAIEADDTFSEEIWSWFSKGGGDSGSTEIRNINDTGDLMNSIQIEEPVVKGAHITASLRWDSAHEEGPYAEIVHNGRRAYFQEEAGERDYAARPWTFLLAPPEQRDSSQLNAIAGSDPETLPSTRWDAALRRFETELQSNLAQTQQVAG